ncbi:MAG TPA: OsmC family protein [Candidatus Coprenecus merdipullorum]|nr:OsmC family protein [Candidatus Coprenecus merdipullorum]
MTKMRTTYLGNLRTEILHEQSGNKIITDAPLDNHGKGEYFSPTDMFASSLASCMLTIMGISAQSYGFNIDGTTVEIEKEMAANPRRVARIVVDITFPKGQKYDDKAKRLIESAARTCPVSNSLHPDIIKDIRFHYDE